MKDEEKKTTYSYVMQGWPTKEVPMEETPDGLQPALVPLPYSDKVRKWCQAGHKVRVTFEVVDEVEEQHAERKEPEES